MEEPITSSESANSGSLPEQELLILHTPTAHEWSAYLHHILKSSKKLRKRSIFQYAVSPADELHGYNFECFQGCKCILLIFTGELLDMLCDPNLQGALQKLLYPPQRVVALLCGVSEDDIQTESFEDWPRWRKLLAEDEPPVYISTVLESIADSRRVQAEGDSDAAAELHDTADEIPSTDIKEEVGSGEEIEASLKNEEQVGEETSASTHVTCLTVQPNRLLCGVSITNLNDVSRATLKGRETLFIIFTQKLDAQTVPEVQFSLENTVEKRVPGTWENEYTISVAAPDMPAGVVSLTLYTDQFSVSLKPVTYYTVMGEISWCFETAADPVNFICQAFNLMSDATDSLDDMLTDSLKSRMPATGFQLFGVRQIEEDNMTAYQRNEELPTLLHFAAKYGLKKLTTTLLHCPGALQACSVMNKFGDYPNTLAEKSGFSALRQFIDEFVETAAMLQCHFQDSVNTEESPDVYELMSTTSQDIMKKYTGCSEDIYESMFGINPEVAEDLYEMMSSLDENPEEAILRKFLQAKPHDGVEQDGDEHLKSDGAEGEDQKDLDQAEEEEDPYNLIPEDIYDTVDADSMSNPLILNRPPAPLPRPECEPEKPVIVTVFSMKSTSEGSTAAKTRCASVQPTANPPSPVHDSYAVMKTPGQRQLISLQERVKVGDITVDEAVQEFKAWQFDNNRRADSIRYQQENLKKLRDSIIRRHKERKDRAGKEIDYEISAPLQRNLYWGSNRTLECAVYESAPRAVASSPPPAAQVIQRSTWKTGSTSSTSSSGSNRHSTHSTFSYSSGTEPELEDVAENLSRPPRPPRPSNAASHMSPPTIPPRVPERTPDTMLHERYIAHPQRPSQRHADVAPPVPRRLR